ncbi:methyltransferase [Micromonospora robiginosa]|uniref:Methyltransferase n=1 Tax=Micromonospora robiginosa TaxID=2749844 RepID=A0A7L6B1R9_9ACTN|nr:methyltransferase [Micromonospora ferruginea]QLQ35877.1 methyltransferase [Micromonospora ferruginea]
MAPSRPRIDIESVFRLTELADYIVPFTVRAVADLGIADQLTDGPRPVAELADATGAHAPSLLRALRALAGKGIFTEVEPEVFALTPLAEPLRTDHPLSLRDAYPLLAPDIEAWAHFDHSIRTGKAAFDQVHPEGYWSYMAAHPRDSARFDASQQAATRLELRAALPAYPWGDLGTMVDVGGGNGAFLGGIMARFPNLRGTLFDLPHVVAEAEPVLQKLGVAQRCTVTGGSFFETVPAGADAYMLKRILYGWDDDGAVRLLRAVRAAMRPDSRLLVLEPVVEPGDRFDVGRLYDLLLLAMVGGGARSREHIERLLDVADLKLARSLPTMMFPILEIVPKTEA